MSDKYFYNLAYRGELDRIIELIDDENTLCICLSGACNGGHLNVVKKMLEFGATNWNTGFLAACQNNHIDIVIHMTELALSKNMILDNELGITTTLIHNYSDISLYIYKTFIEKLGYGDIDWENVFTDIAKSRNNTAITNLISAASDIILDIGLRTLCQYSTSDITIILLIIKTFNDRRIIINYNNIIKICNVNIALFLINHFNLKISQNMLNDKLHECEIEDKNIALSFIQLGAVITYYNFYFGFNDIYDLFYYRGIKEMEKYKGYIGIVEDCIKYHNTCIDKLDEVIKIQVLNEIIMGF